MSNPFDSRAASLSGPGVDYAPVTPSNTTPLPDVAIALYVESGGAVRFTSQKGQTRTVTVPNSAGCFAACGRCSRQERPRAGSTPSS